MAQDYITIDLFNGEQARGFEIKHQRELPKTAKLFDCTYDANFNNINRYISIGKKHTKWFLLRTKY